MNINGINAYTNIFNYVNRQRQRITSKLPLIADCFCGTSSNKKVSQIENNLQYIKSYFENPIDITPTPGLVFDSFDEKCIDVNLRDLQFEEAIRPFYSSAIKKEDRVKFCEIAKQILKFDDKNSFSTAEPSIMEKELDKRLDTMAKVIKQYGFVKDNEHYTVKHIWKFNPYKTLRCALDNNINALRLQNNISYFI